VQLWVAQPEATRHGEAAFEHLAELPQVELDGANATVLVGALAGAVSDARQDTPLLGVDVRLRPGVAVLPLDPSYEHVVVVLDGPVQVDGRLLEAGRSAYLGLHREELVLEAPEAARVLLLGGEPLGEEVLMWWNFVGRTREEIVQAARQWAAGKERFGRVRSDLARIPAPALPWV
jgi:redox-sensitive bicupin YhaK (pirin superfamily)